MRFYFNFYKEILHNQSRLLLKSRFFTLWTVERKQVIAMKIQKALASVLCVFLCMTGCSSQTASELPSSQNSKREELKTESVSELCNEQKLLCLNKDASNRIRNKRKGESLFSWLFMNQYFCFSSIIFPSWRCLSGLGII